MNINIASAEDLLKECADIQAFLDITCSEDITEIIARGNDLSAYIARTGKMVADSEYHRDVLLQSSSMALLKEVGKKYVPATTINKLIDAACKDANYLCKWTDRLNRTATHQLDWCRTMISKIKEEMKYSGGIY